MVLPTRLAAFPILLLGVAAGVGPPGSHDRIAGKYRPSLIGQLAGPDDVAIAFTSDGKRILSAGGRTARVWDGVTLKPITQPLQHGSDLLTARFDSRGTRVLTVGAEYVHVWDAETGQPTSPRLPHARSVPIRDARLSPDGVSVLTIADRPHERRRGIRYELNPRSPDTTVDQRSVKIWDVATGELRHSLEHRSFVEYADFSPDGSRILTVSAFLGGSACLWNASSGKQVMEAIDDAIGGSPSAAFSGDGKRFAVTGWYRVDIHGTDDGRRIRTIDDFEHHDLPVGVALAPDGNTLVATSQLSDLRMWDVRTGKPSGGEMRAGLSSENELVFNAEGTQFLLSGYDFEGAGLWDLTRGRNVWRPSKGMGRIGGAWFGPDGDARIGCRNGGSVAVYRITH